MHTTHEDPRTGEIVELVHVEEPGVLRIRFYDDTEDVLTVEDFEAQYVAVTVEADDDEWTAADESRHQKWLADRAAQAEAAHQEAHRDWFARTGRQRPGCC